MPAQKDAHHSVLVTGAGGFIGLNLVEALLVRSTKVVAFSREALPEQALAEFATLPGRLVVIEGDVCDSALVARVLRSEAISHVVHCAALTPSADADASRARQVIEVNVVGTEILLEACAAAQVRRFILPSSSAVYGAAVFGKEPPDEATPPQPNSLYGISKLSAECLGAHARRARGLDVIVVRLTAMFGPWERANSTRDTPSPLWQIARCALAAEPVCVHEGGGRDWTCSQDAAVILADLLEAGQLEHTLYNLSVGSIWHPRIFCEELARRMPGFSWRQADAAHPTNLRYYDQLDRQRVALKAGHLAQLAQGQAEFLSPARSAQRYADWVLKHPAWFR
ncbi:MAG: NAD(P)-dependent oxidoreductase [Burkholderiaceae bacterium]|nr:NAD(P)-dependent oxidoreductase [Burkholderiaceae bacterium]MDP1968999.1 NAD(P)-dependent oxidoreductase [Burkholderiaceae bacterium]